MQRCGTMSRMSRGRGLSTAGKCPVAWPLNKATIKSIRSFLAIYDATMKRCVQQKRLGGRPSLRKPYDGIFGVYRAARRAAAQTVLQVRDGA